MENKKGLLYPLIVVASIAVIVFSIVGVATMTGYMPSALSQKSDPAVQPVADKPAEAAKPSTKAAEKRASARPSGERSAPPSAPPRDACADCGTIQSVRAHEVQGQGSGAGVIGGAVLGGVLGHQVGSGRGQDLATVAGAIGGGLAGNEIEKNARKSVRYEIEVRMDNGSVRTLTQAAPPQAGVGDRVRVENGVIVARG